MPHPLHGDRQVLKKADRYSLIKCKVTTFRILSWWTTNVAEISLPGIWIWFQLTGRDKSHDSLYKRVWIKCPWQTIEFGSQKNDSQHFIDPAQSTGINLTVLHGIGLQELFKHHSVLTHFSSGNSNTQWHKCLQKKQQIIFSYHFYW